jgi:protein Tex
MSAPPLFDPVVPAAADLGLPDRQVRAVAALFAEGNTLPFIARYRKEVHGNLDEVQIADIQERLSYYGTLEARRQTILKSIEEQGALTETLRGKIEAARSKSEIEDYYLPFKPKRRTRAAMAREKGLEPLARLMMDQPAQGAPAAAARQYVNKEKGVADEDAALAGARDIVAEWIAENAEARAWLRKTYGDTGLVISEATPSDTPPEASKYKDYFDFRQAIRDIPSHRYLAIRRGENEGVLRRRLSIDADAARLHIAELCGRRAESPFAAEFDAALHDAYKRLLAPAVEMDVAVEMKMAADRAAVEIFARNLRSLLLAAPFGEKAVVGVDPGLRTGCKCAAVDATGKYLGATTVYPSQGAAQAQRAQAELAVFIEKYAPQAVAVGNGTAGRETEALVREVLKRMDRQDVAVVSVSEAGASVYSASALARAEFPDLDLTVRGAISIARRLQDPLAELVKVDPKSIGVGQYQHDVYPERLKDKLDEVVVSCVNRVGVELNTASAPLLARVAGIGDALAHKIVAHRDRYGAFRSRQDLLKVPGLGPRAFEQCAGFLRIRGGAHPLDASAVHPERYKLVETMAADLKTDLKDLIGHAERVAAIRIEAYIGPLTGEPTLRDIVAELQKPGRDPRDRFEATGFRDDVTSPEHLTPGMTLQGVVTNVTAFGAFVDIGVHQDGLVHISQLSDRFIRDPAEVVQAGDRIQVRVLEVDLARKRIGLSARPAAAAAAPAPPKKRSAPAPTTRTPAPPAARRPRPAAAFTNNPFDRLLPS